MQGSVAEIFERVSRAALLAHGAGDWQAETGGPRRGARRGNGQRHLRALLPRILLRAAGQRPGGRTVRARGVRARAGLRRVDARFGFAQPAFARALPHGAGGGAENGVATLAVAHSHTCTSLGFFTEQIAAEGLIAMGMTNASAIVAGPGGRTPVLGTNPFAGHDPGDGMARRCTPISRPPPWRSAGSPWPRRPGSRSPKAGRWMPRALPTTDPEAALAGALQSAAGHKGWALGLMVEAFAAGLTGSVNSLDVKGLKAAGGAAPRPWPVLHPDRPRRA
jgi:(2R)-3-sulfolactate dehydrogenase (NADP+)